MGANDDLADQLTRHRLWLLRFEAGTVNDAVEAYTEATAPAMEQLLAMQRYLNLLRRQEATGRPLTTAQVKKRDTLQRKADRLRRRLPRQLRTARNTVQDGLQQRLSETLAAEQAITVARLSAALPSGVQARPPLDSLGELLRAPLAGRAWPERLDGGLLAVADRVDAALAHALSRGVGMAEATRMLEAAVGEIDGGRNRLVTIARTEVQRVANAAAQRTYAANADVIRAVQYLATLDSRTCLRCAPLRNEVFELNPTDGTHIGPTLPLHPRCFPAGVVVSGPAVQASTSRHYTGQLIDIETADGRRLSTTPNHPMLTTRGWVAAGLLDEGDDLISCRSLEGVLRGDPDDHQVPTLIEEVANTIRKAGTVSSVVVPAAPENFHGDGEGSEVNIVWPDRLLIDGWEACTVKPSLQLQLSRGDVQAACLDGLGALDLCAHRDGSASSSALGCCDIPSVLLRGAVAHLEPVGLQLPPQLYAGPLQPLGDQGPRGPVLSSESGQAPAREVAGGDLLHWQRAGTIPDAGSLEDWPVLFPGPPDAALLECLAKTLGADAHPCCDRVAALAGNVGLDRILKLSRRSFSGHVYNLETSGGWYVANGIITHNCRCFYVPVTRSWSELGIDVPPAERDDLDGEPAGQTGFEAWLKRQSASEQRAFFGSEQRRAAWRSGGVPLSDFTDRGRVLSLGELSSRL